MPLLAASTLAACGLLPASPPKQDAGPRDGGVLPVSDGGTMPVDGGLSIADACPLINQRRCDFLARCGLIASTPVAHAECVRQLEVSWCGPLTWPPHVARGTLRYDAVRSAACADAFLTQGCAEWKGLPDSCTRFLLPRAALGGDCYDGYAACAEGVCRGSSCPRTCQPRALLDEVCTVDADCRSGLYCRFPPFLSPVGQCAAYGNVGAACSTTALCADGLRCVAEQCRALPLAGSLCLAGQCAATSYCEGVLDGGVCAERKPEGAACSGEQCAAGLVCDALSSTCARASLASGDPCTLSQRCPPAEACIGATERRAGFCDRPRAEGEDCVTDRDCEEHLGCLAGDGGASCQRRLAAGSACTSQQACQAGATCLDGTCTPLPLPGESCTTTRTCRWGLCRELVNTDGGAVCGALLSAGQPCLRHDECASGSCRSGTCVARCLP